VDAYTRRVSGWKCIPGFASRKSDARVDAIVGGAWTAVGHPLDNGAELTSRHFFLAGCVERQIDWVHIQPGKPTQKRGSRVFHGRLASGVDDELVFRTVECARKIAALAEDFTTNASAHSLDTTPRKTLRPSAGSRDFDTAERGQGTSNAVLALALPHPGSTPRMELNTPLVVVSYLTEK